MFNKMNSLVYLFLYVADSFTSEKYNFFPNLPVGEYKFYLKAIENNCVPPSSRNDIRQNFYLFKKSANETEVRGNATLNIPFDDSLDIDISMAVKDSIGGWKYNAFVYNSHKACSTAKLLSGGAWTPLLKGLGFINTTCPIREGFYTATGADPSLLYRYGYLPKSFFYGTYKFRMILSKKKECLCCVIYLVDIKRPWEMA